jgi:hypothetical protein
MTQRKNDVVKWLGILITVIVLVIGGIKTASVLAYRVEENDKIDKEEHTKLDGYARENRENILKIQTDIAYIKQGVDEIKQQVKDK